MATVDKFFGSAVHNPALAFSVRVSGRQGALSLSDRDRPRTDTVPCMVAGHKGVGLEELWQQFFSDPSQWWDHRSDKLNPGYPDFKHKKTGFVLWVDGRLNPLWVKEEIAALTPGIVPRSPFSWNALLARYVKSEQGLEALELFQQLQAEGVNPDSFTYVMVANACAILADLSTGKSVHAQIIHSGYESDVYVGSSLVNMYTKCGSVEDAYRVFNEMPLRNVVTWTTMLAGFVKCELGLKALELYQQMQAEGLEPDVVTFMTVLNACASSGALEEGRRVHAQIIQSGWESDLHLGNCLVDMYGKCGSTEDAWIVFDKMPIRDVVSWTSMLAGHVKCKQGQKALELYQQMQAEQVKPNTITFATVLNACGSVQALEQGRLIHAEIIQRGCCDVQLRNCLVDMYAKCWSIDDAQTVFDEMPIRGVVSWNGLIVGCVKCNQGWKALSLYQQMQVESVQPNTATFVAVANACASLALLKEGRNLHAQVIENGCESDVFVASSLIDMYGKSGSMEDAINLFNRMSLHNVVSWTTMIAVYVNCNQGENALELYQKMQEEGVKPNGITLATLAHACASLAALEEGRSVHTEVIKNGFETDVFVAISLIDMYAKCGNIDDAWIVFDQMPVRNVVSWNVMLAGYVRCGKEKSALKLYECMQADGVKPDKTTFVMILNACSSLGELKEGRHIHAQIIQNGYHCNLHVGNSLIDMYAKCGSLDDAQKVFNEMPSNDVVSWTVLIGGYVTHGQVQQALRLYQVMLEKGVRPDSVILVLALNACASSAALEQGRCAHAQVIRSCCESDVVVASSLLDMYAKCMSIQDAERVFNNMLIQDIVSWTSMIVGYVKCGQGQKALELYQQLQAEGVKPNCVTFTAVINACASLKALEEGRSVHAQAIESGCLSDLHTANALLDMYAKCRSMDDAWALFSHMPVYDVVSWNTMLLGLVKCGQGHKALEMYHQMKMSKVKPNSATFTTLLNACSSIVTLDGGRCIHNLVIENGLEYDEFVGSSLINMYAKCGSLEDAWRVFKEMPTHDVVSWTSMLGGLAMHGFGREALGFFEEMREAGVQINGITFVCLLSACSHAGLVDEGLHYFESMHSVYGISPTAEHCICVVDLLGRAGRLDEAESIVQKMSLKPNVKDSDHILDA